MCNETLTDQIALFASSVMFATKKHSTIAKKFMVVLSSYQKNVLKRVKKVSYHVKNVSFNNIEAQSFRKLHETVLVTHKWVMLSFYVM